MSQIFLSLHAVIGGAAAPLGTHPVDVLTVVLDVTGLAVDAVGSIDNQAHGARVVRLIFIHTCWTEPEKIFDQNQVY